MSLFSKKSKSVENDTQVEACGSCECPQTQPDCRVRIPMPVKDCCHATAIRQILKAILKEVNEANVPGFGVEVEITTETGAVYTVDFTCGVQNPVQITDTSLCTQSLNISLNTITKILISTSDIVGNTKFATSLLKEIQKITTFGGGRGQNGNDSRGGCEATFAQCLQNFINKNNLEIDYVNYNGGMATVEDFTGVSDINNVNVVGAANLQQTNGTGIATAALVAPGVEVVGEVNVANTNVVTDINTEPASVITRVNSTPVLVSPPITTTPVSVISSDATTQQSLLTDVTSTPATVSAPVTLTPTPIVSGVTLNNVVTKVVTSVESEDVTIANVTGAPTVNGLTGVATSTTVTGVLSGLATAGLAGTTQYTIPQITQATGTPPAGAAILQVIIPAGTFGDFPADNLPLNVTLATAPTAYFTVAASQTANAFPTQTLAVTGTTIGEGNPTTTNLSIPATYNQQAFVTGVTTEPTTVSGPLIAAEQPGSIVTNVATGSVNNPSFTGAATATVVGGITPAPLTVTTLTDTTPVTINNPTIPGPSVSVASNVNGTSGTITTVTGTVSEQPLSDLIETVPQEVVESADLLTTSNPVVNSVGLNTIPQTVVGSIDTTTESVLAPVDEPIDGTILCAGNGVMTVSNENGDISLYSICDINAVSRDEK